MRIRFDVQAPKPVPNLAIVSSKDASKREILPIKTEVTPCVVYLQ